MTAATIVLLSLTSGIPVEVRTLDGEVVTGNLAELTPAKAVVETAGTARNLPVATLQEVRLTDNTDRTATGSRSQSEIELVDGSHWIIGDAQLSGASMKLASERLGDFTVPKETVRRLRLGKSNSQLESAWNKLNEQDTTDDLVIVRKGDALDHYGGVVSGIDSEAVKFLLDGEPVPIPRARVFGIVFANRRSESTPAVGRIDLTSGDQLHVKSLGFGGDDFRVQLSAGASVTLTPAEIRRLDFSLGKIRYLSDQEPSEVRYTPLELSVADEFPEIAADLQRFRRDKTREGRPLQVGGKEYSRGLWLHSGTTITYRLLREYRSFRAVMDIDQGIVSEFCDPAVSVVIRGDGKELLSTTVRRADDAQQLDLDVTNVRDLQIEVIPTDPTGMCEHLDLADARVIK